MISNVDKENVKLDGRIPFKAITSNVINKQSLKFKESGKSQPAKVTRCKSTQTETQYSERGCGTSDNAAEAMISALTGGPLNETYFESLAEQRREALEITIEENEELYKQIEQLNISLKEATDRAEEAEAQLKATKAKLSETKPVPIELDISKEEKDEISDLLTLEQAP